MLIAERRQHDGWGMRVNYTFSVRKDNQFGEGNSSREPQRALDNYDLDREFGYSLLDAPHRAEHQRDASSCRSARESAGCRGGAHWRCPGRLGIQRHRHVPERLPVGVFQTTTPDRRVRLRPAAERRAGRRASRPASPEDNYDPTCACIRWLNPAAWSSAAPFTFGDAPRTDTGAHAIAEKLGPCVPEDPPLGGTSVTVRAELINAFNNPAFGGPRLGYGLADFGQITALSASPGTLQLSARLAW